MEKANKKIIYEYLLVNSAYRHEFAQMTDDKQYTRWHEYNKEAYDSLGHRFNSILGYTGQTDEDFMQFMSSVQLSPEQKRALVELRREPMFKKLMGETALQQKSELESVLGSKITAEGMTFADEYGAEVSFKTEEQLETEENAYHEKLGQLLASGTITEEQYERYNQNIQYIYTYYVSLSNGEQIPFRKMTDTQYEQIEQNAENRGVNFDEQLRKENADLRFLHGKRQDLMSDIVAEQERRKRGLADDLNKQTENTMANHNIDDNSISK